MGIGFYSASFFSAKTTRQGYNQFAGEQFVDPRDGGRNMARFPQKMAALISSIGLVLMISSCSRSVSTPEGPEATPIDLSVEQTLTMLSLPEDSESGDNQPENTATATQPPPQPTETPFPEETETPPDATSTSEIIDESSESSTGNAISVTQTVTPAMVPSAGTGDEQWTIAYLDQAPVIDGDINDWPGTIYAMDKVVFGPEFYANQIDLFGEFKFGWDADDLYLGVLVRDSQFVQTSTDALLFQGDSIEVLLDTDWSGDQNSDTLSADDYQLGFSPGNLVDISLPEAYMWAPSDREGPMQSALVKGRLTDDGYMVEIAIAWEELGVTPTAGMTLGFLLSVSDNDFIGQNKQQTVISISETRNLTNPTTWLPVILAAP